MTVLLVHIGCDGKKPEDVAVPRVPLSNEKILEGFIKPTGWNGWYLDCGESAYLLNDALPGPGMHYSEAEGALVRVYGETIERPPDDILDHLSAKLEGDVLVFGYKVLKCPALAHDEIKKLVETGKKGPPRALRIEGYFGRVEKKPGVFLSLENARQGKSGEGTFVLNGASIYRTDTGEPFIDVSVGDRVVCDGYWVAYGDVYFEDINTHLLSVVYNFEKKEE